MIPIQRVAELEAIGTHLFHKACCAYSKFEELRQCGSVDNIFNHGCGRPRCAYGHDVVLLKELCVIGILDNCDDLFKF